jgi:hypothetical protein
VVCIVVVCIVEIFTPTPSQRRPLRPVMNSFYISSAEKLWHLGQGVGVY